MAPIVVFIQLIAEDVAPVSNAATISYLSSNRDSALIASGISSQMKRKPHRTLRRESPDETIQLFRGDTVVSSLLGAFGSSLRETRLTALLGYLIALDPEAFRSCFGFKGHTRSVSLETSHDGNRSDILIETTLGNAIIEAKTGTVDPLRQARKYPARWRILLTQHIPSASHNGFCNVRYVTWKTLAHLLKTLTESSKPKMRFVCNDLLVYMEEHNMIRTKDAVEVYAREINEENTLALFLKAGMYGCNYEKGSRLAEALYFAPHFGFSIAAKHPGIQQGISYLARIEAVEVVESWSELLEVTKNVRNGTWLNSHRKIIEPLRKNESWQWGKKIQRSFLFLKPPRLVFNPPISKDNLQKGRGWLSKRFFSFEELFAAWGC